MSVKSLARGSATRTANKLRRRERILDCAREIIAKQGYDALTLAQLAKDAEVTIPTIHNLLGKKSQIIEVLVGEVVSHIDTVLARQAGDDPIQAIHDFTKSLMDLYGKDETLYKAAFVAGERAQLFEHQSQDGIFNRSLNLAVDLCENALANGHLNGDIPTRILAAQLFGCQRLARLDWMNNYISIKDYRTRILSGMFAILAISLNCTLDIGSPYSRVCAEPATSFAQNKKKLFAQTFSNFES